MNSTCYDKVTLSVVHSGQCACVCGLCMSIDAVGGCSNESLCACLCSYGCLDMSWLTRFVSSVRKRYTFSLARRKWTSCSLCCHCLRMNLTCQLSGCTWEPRWWQVVLVLLCALLQSESSKMLLTGLYCCVWHSVMYIVFSSYTKLGWTHFSKASVCYTTAYKSLFIALLQMPWHDMLHLLHSSCCVEFVCVRVLLYDSCLCTVSLIKEDADKASIDTVCGALKASRNVSFLPSSCTVCTCMLSSTQNHCSISCVATGPKSWHFC